MVEFENGRGSLGHLGDAPFPILAHRNRTCRSPASGSPTGFTVRHTASKLTARGFNTVKSLSFAPRYSSLGRRHTGALHIRIIPKIDGNSVYLSSRIGGISVIGGCRIKPASMPTVFWSILHGPVSFPRSSKGSKLWRPLRTPEGSNARRK
jgi:hypothetical protein